MLRFFPEIFPEKIDTKDSVNRLISILLFLWLAPLLADRDVHGDISSAEVSRYLDVRLDLDRLAVQPGQKVMVRYRITNQGYRIFRIFPHEDSRRTFQFLVEDKAGKEVAPRERPEDASEQPVRDLVGNRVKEILLHPGETFEKTMDLNAMYDLSPGQEYRVCAYFVPDQESDLAIRSKNWARVRVSKMERAPAAREQDAAVSSDSGLSPEETVYLFLSAEIKHNWPAYLKHVDLPRFVGSYDRFALKYAQASDLERPGVLREFSTYLTRRDGDDLKRFRILRTDLDRDKSGEILPTGNARVTVQADRDTEGFRVRYEYVYTLKRAEQEGFWKIIHVSARVVRQGQS